MRIDHVTLAVKDLETLAERLRDWNRRVDEAWSQHVLGITNQRSNDE